LFYDWNLPQKVFSTAKFLNDDKNEVITSLNAILWFEDNKMAQFDISFDMSRRQSALVTGSTSSFRLDNFITAGDGQLTYEISKDRDYIQYTINPCIQERAVIESFTNKISNEWGEQSLKTQIVLDALEESSLKETVISINKN
jgi:hypothetical protein